MTLTDFFQTRPAAVLAEDNMQSTRPDDEVKFFIDSEPAYYAVMDRFGDHIDFRGDDMVAPLRLWGAIQQTAGDAGGAADIAGLEDDRMRTNDKLDEQGVAEGHGNYAGDRPFNLGGMSIKKIQIGDTVRYIDQKAQVVDMSRDREHARITIPSNSTTKTVRTSDLRSLGRGMAEDDDAVQAFLARGGKIQQLDPQRGPRRSGMAFASKHIGSASGRGTTKGKVSGLAAATGKSNKPVVTAEQTVAEANVSKDHDQQLRVQQLDELSPATLASYKTKAGAAATAADLTGDRRTADRRFSGIVKATKKQFDQDATQSAQKMHESRLTLMADIIKSD